MNKLGFSCLDYRGADEICCDCKLAVHGYCEGFRKLLENRIIPELSENNNSTSVKEGRRRRVLFQDEIVYDYDEVFQKAFNKIEEKISGFEGRSSFETWATTFITFKKIDYLRNYSKKSKKIRDIVQDDQDLKVVVGDIDTYKSITDCGVVDNTRSPSKQSPAETTLQILGHINHASFLFDRYLDDSQKKIAILLCGSEEPTDALKCFVARNHGVLLWYPENINPEFIKTKIEKRLRTYHDSESLTLNSDFNDGECGSEKDVSDDSLERSYGPKLSGEIERCFKKLLLVPELKKCGMQLYDFYTIGLYFDDQGIVKKNGEPRKGAILSEMANRYGQTITKVKKSYDRCKRSQGNVISQFLDECAEIDLKIQRRSPNHQRKQEKSQ